MYSHTQKEKWAKIHTTHRNHFIQMICKHSTQSQTSNVNVTKYFKDITHIHTHTTTIRSM